MVELREHQAIALNQLRSGAILQGGVGSGKSITGLAYYYIYELGGNIKPMMEPKKNKPLYIITTAKKRDSLEWEKECGRFSLSTNQEVSISGIKVVVDSWNNIGKYEDVKDAFFIFDEQRLVGYGAWSKAFLSIAKQNNWILLTATPGDAWIDYLSVFIANGFYKNKTEFVKKHITYSRFAKYPKIDHYRNTDELITHRDSIVVQMSYEHPISIRKKVISVDYDKELLEIVSKKRWNIYDNKPIKHVGELIFLQRKVVNSDRSRLEKLNELYETHKRLIVFYNFDYELYLLRDFLTANKIPFSEWNGHKHNDIPTSTEWIYLVNYTAGSEGWECVTTDTVVMYSQNYSYKTLVQSEGRITRLNTPFSVLYYYYLVSDAYIDVSIRNALKSKKDFNEHRFRNKVAA